MLGSQFSCVVIALASSYMPASAIFIAGSDVAHKPATKAPAVISMPDAYSEGKYDTTLDPGKGSWKQPTVCVPIPALLVWLKLDCSNSTFKFSGTVPSIDKDVVSSFHVNVIDANNNRFEYQLRLTQRPTVETVPLNKEAGEAEAKAAAATPDYSKIQLLETTPIGEGVSQAAGLIRNLPPRASLHIQIWTQPEGQAGPPTQMQLVNSAAPPATVPQVDLKGNTYSLQFPTPLAAGQTVTLLVVKDDGTPVAASTKLFTSAITIGTMNLNVETPVSVGAKSVSGTLSNMPVPAVKPVPASGITAATYGNYPGIVVWWSDAVSKKWSQAAPTVGANPLQFLSVNADGSFVVNLPSALQAGQTIRVDVVPPPGRSFIGALPLLPLPAPPSAPRSPLSKEITVLSDVALSQPTISSTPFNEGTTVISGTATIPSSGLPVGVAVLRLKNQTQTESGKEVPREIVRRCIRVDELGSNKFASFGHLLPLTSSSSNTLLGTVDATAGTYKVTLAEALKQDDWIQVIQVLPVGAALPLSQFDHCASAPRRVTYPFDFYRTNISFVAGVLISNSSSSSSTSANFSQANQFYAFNADHAWRLPGYDCVQGLKWGSLSKGRCNQPDGWHSLRRIPGNNSFFEGRLTSIPVSTAATTITPAANSSGSAASSSSGTSTPSTSASPTLLTSQKVFRVETGIFFYWVITHGSGDHPQGLFIGPLSKAGFDTVTGAGTSSNVILPGGSVGSLDFQTAYKFYAYGARLGNMSLSQSPGRAPLIEHYLDITVGRYSNLQSYICHHVPAGQSHAQPGSSCTTDYPAIFRSTSDVIDSRKQLYRLDFEGLVRIPVPATAIPFYIGFNANIAQHTWQAEYLDHGYAPPDDIRILFGTRIDIGSLLSSFKLGTN